MEPSYQLSLLLLSAVVLVVAVLLTMAYTLARHRSRIGSGRPSPRDKWPKRSWQAEWTDPVSRLRSPYKTVPLCDRCFAMRRAGRAPFFVCRLDKGCGLLEDERADLP